MTYSPFPAVDDAVFDSAVPRPPIIRIGGKVRLSAALAPILASFPFDFYVEPFCGSSAVFLRLFRQSLFYPYTHRFPVLNDADRLLVNLFSVLRNAPHDLLRALFFSPVSRADHSTASDFILADQLLPILPQLPDTAVPPSPDSLRLAVAYLTATWQSFNCQPAKSFAFSYSGAISQRILVKWLSVPRRIRAAAVALRYAYLECEDALANIERWAGNGTLFYCDPPYYGKEFYYQAANGMPPDYHRRLADLLATVPASGVVVSYYPVPEVMELYPESLWERIYLVNSLSSKVVARHCEADSRKRDKVREVVFVRRNSNRVKQLSLFDAVDG